MNTNSETNHDRGAFQALRDERKLDREAAEPPKKMTLAQVRADVNQAEAERVFARLGIVNQCDRPHARLVAYRNDEKCHYISDDLIHWPVMSAEDFTPLSAFGMTLSPDSPHINAAGRWTLCLLLDPGLITAQYTDGRPRLWQGDTVVGTSLSFDFQTIHNIETGEASGAASAGHPDSINSDYYQRIPIQ